MNWYHESSALFEGNKAAVRKATREARARREKERTQQRIDNATAMFWLAMGTIVSIGTLYAILLEVMA